MFEAMTLVTPLTTSTMLTPCNVPRKPALVSQLITEPLKVIEPLGPVALTHVLVQVRQG